MSFLSVSDAARMAGVSVQSVLDEIANGELKQAPAGIAVVDLIQRYPSLKPLANVKIRNVKTTAVLNLASSEVGDDMPSPHGSANDKETITAVNNEHAAINDEHKVALLIKELEWNKQLLEQTNQNMAQQLAKQQAMIADQARRLDEKDRFWARQVEIAQSLLPAPAPQKRKKLFGIF